jgi:tRNA 2-selenouridine synthase
LADRLGMLTALHGKETIAAWQAMAHAGDLAPLFEQLAVRHYDPAYSRSQRVHFREWEQRQITETADLSPAGIDDLARRIASAQNR